MAHHAQYQAGARQHVQALVFVGSREKGGMIPWGPAVLSAKGYQAGNVVKAFKDWERHTAPAPQPAAPSVRSGLQSAWAKVASRPLRRLAPICLNLWMKNYWSRFSSGRRLRRKWSL